MNKFIIACVAMICLVGSGYASNYSHPYSGNGLNSSNVSTGGARTLVQEQNISKSAENAAISYIWGRLGEKYYNQHISYSSGAAYGNLSYAYFTYSVPFANGTAGAPQLLSIVVTLNGSQVSNYTGPEEPYVVNVSAAQAAVIANQYGISNGTRNVSESIEGVHNGTEGSGYMIVWAVTAGASMKGNVYPGVYVDAESGKVVGEYISNQQLIGAQSSGYGTAGNFSLFYISNITANQTSSGSGTSQESPYLLPLVILGIVIFASGVYLSRKR